MEWTGRVDGHGPLHARWHQVVRHGEAAGRHVSLLGFASDEGVRRNHGRVGAAGGPAALRHALANLPWSLSLPGPRNEDLLDHGDTTVDDGDLEAAQERMGQRIANSLAADGNLLTVVLGGGHETAYASYLGLTAALPDARWGVLNLDAHFDLRDAPRPSSGTPFQQMALAQQAAGREFRYAVAGISRHANTRILFERAEELGVEFLLDVDCTPERIVDVVERFASDLDVLYLTVDLDVLPAAVAPGVSAPAALGVAPGAVVAAVTAAAATGKLRLMDVVELNPGLDIDSRTARIGARLIADAVTAAG